ncbi:MAG: hypothetical protein IJ494_00895 [Bacteroides sp.]|nr:hypothetical protein [Bacteroides sp.]
MKRYFLFLVALLAFTGLRAQQVHNARTPYDPATIPVTEEQRGEILKLQMNDSKMYPGTAREVWVYVPRQYDGSKPACLLVCMDGILYDATTILDNLISTGEMPVTIGVFIAPGVVYDEEGEVVRYNRCKEFDSTDGNLATFIESEVLPFVETQTTLKGYPIRLSKNANDRAITGASSGGIASFSVAWHRPDLFSRIYTSVGTFVSMRGGNNYPALVRKTEPKPLRIYMQDGWYDVWNPIFGEWFEYNQLMESALNFAGYELNFKWDRGNHSIRWGTLAFPEAMRWLWRGYPAPVQKGKSRNGMLADILLDEEDWKEVAPAELPTSPLYAAEDSSALYASGNTLYRLFADGTTTPAGTLKNGERLVGKDLILKGNSLYKQGKKVVDGLQAVEAVQELSDGRFIVLSRKTQSRGRVVVVNEGCRALAVSPDYRLLVTGEEHSNHLISTILSKEGKLLYSEPFYYLHDTDNGTKQTPLDMTFDTAGNLYVATPIGIQVADHNGRVRAILSLPAGRMTSIAFSGHYLYALCGNKLFVRRMNAVGHNPWQEPIKVKSQGQG